MTDAERQKRRYDRKKSGLIRLEIWVPADRAAAVRDAVDAVLRSTEPAATLQDEIQATENTKESGGR